ncbi:MAG TPA: nucleotidyltransferase domain-containing protein [Anaerolineaceae bacterium]
MRTLEDIQGFLSQVGSWAAGREDVLAVALVGSYARGSAREDSDIDLLILCAAPGDLLADPSWMGQFGAVLRQQGEDYGKVTSLRAWYVDGREVEFGIASRIWAAHPLDDGTRRVIQDGMRVIFEREPVLPR